MISSSVIWHFLNKSTTDYLEGLDREDLNASLTDGKIKLENFSLKKDNINKILSSTFPFKIKYSHIGKIFVDINFINITE